MSCFDYLNDFYDFYGFNEFNDFYDFYGLPFTAYHSLC